MAVLRERTRWERELPELDRVERGQCGSASGPVCSKVEWQSAVPFDSTNGGELSELPY